MTKFKNVFMEKDTKSWYEFFSVRFENSVMTVNKCVFGVVCLVTGLVIIFLTGQ